MLKDRIEAFLALPLECMSREETQAGAPRIHDREAEMFAQCEVTAKVAADAPMRLFGFESGAALAGVVGVLIEVPAMLLVVEVVNASKRWFEGKQNASRISKLLNNAMGRLLQCVTVHCRQASRPARVAHSATGW